MSSSLEDHLRERLRRAITQLHNSSGSHAGAEAIADTLSVVMASLGEAFRDGSLDPSTQAHLEAQAANLLAASAAEAASALMGVIDSVVGHGLSKLRSALIKL